MCTGIRFSDDKGNMFFGRNLDWSTGYGERVVVTPRGYKYKSAFLGEMTNSPALIGMGIVAENVPLYFDCANEHGLAIAGLNFPSYAAYEQTAVEGKTNVAAYEFPLWVALNFTSVDDAEESLNFTLRTVLSVWHTLTHTIPPNLPKKRMCPGYSILCLGWL